MTKENTDPGPGGGPAFPLHHTPYPGMTLRDWFAGQALSNSDLCTGRAPDWRLTEWFGEHRTAIEQYEIAAAQAYAYADAMLKARES